MVSNMHVDCVKESDNYSCVTYNSKVTGLSEGMINRVIGQHDLKSVVRHDFNNKKVKLLTTAKNIDELKSGMVKFNVF